MNQGIEEPALSAQERPILVGVDGSFPSEAALRQALFEAKGHNLPLDVITVWNYPPFMSPQDAVSSPAYEEVAREQQKKVLSSVCGEEALPSWVHVEIIRGDAASVLIKRSRRASMVVVGGRGYGGFTGLLLGSVSMKVAAHAKCPVLIVHEEN